MLVEYKNKKVIDLGSCDRLSIKSKDKKVISVGNDTEGIKIIKSGK